MYANGESVQIITDKFEVVEQVEDCRKLFEQLENSLSNTCEQYFRAASMYAVEHGDLNVPKAYKTPTSLSLGQWIVTQRRVRRDMTGGILTESQIMQLDSIGMVWESRTKAAWNRNYASAKAYYEQHGDLLVPTRYKAENGFALGQWINSLRRQTGTKNGSTLLTPERKAQLDEIGMVWELRDWQWENGFRHAAAYFAEHGNLRRPLSFKAKDGFVLEIWLANQKNSQNRKCGSKALEPEKIQRLDAIGMQWETKYDTLWETAYQAAKEYYQ